MNRFSAGGAERPLPGAARRPPLAGSAALRRLPLLLWAARRASARPPYRRSSPPDPVAPDPYGSEGDPVAPRGAARRPVDEPDWPRRAAARPPPCGCGGLRRCSLIERLLLGQAHPCAPGNGGCFPVPPTYGCERFRIHPYCTKDDDVLWRHLVPGAVHGAQTTHRQSARDPELHPKSGKSLDTIRRCDPVHHFSTCRFRKAVLSC
jgi:hypothetical protein